MIKLHELINEMKYKSTIVISAIAIALLSFAYASVSYVHSYEKQINPTSLRAFTVTGEGKVVTKPDVAVFSLTVISEGGKDLAVLQKDNADKTNAITAFLKENGIKEEDIKTTEYSVDPRYKECRLNPSYPQPVMMVPYPTAPTEVQSCPPPEIVGYTVRQSTEVKVRNFDVVGKVLSGVVTKGANSVSQLSFKVDDDTTLQKEARDIAIKKARAKADEIAHAAKFRVGEVIDIQEGYSYPYYARYDTISAYGKGGGDISAAPSISAGSQEIVVNVTIRYEMK